MNDRPISGRVYASDSKGNAAIYLYNTNNDTASIAWISSTGKILATVYANFDSVLTVTGTNLFASIRPLHEGNQPIVTKYTLSGTNLSQEFFPSGDLMYVEDDLSDTNHSGGRIYGYIMITGTNSQGYELSYFPILQRTSHQQYSA